MYEHMLDTKSATLIAAAMLAWLANTIAGNSRITFRALLFNYGPAFGCAFFVVAIFHDAPVSGIDLAAGFGFEFLVLLAYCRLLRDALRYDGRVDERSVERWLGWSFALQLLVGVPLVMSEGFGIFSEGSRIAYLDDGGAAKYLTYAGVLVAIVQAGLIAKRVSAGRSPGPTGYAVVAATFALSTLSGSKGAFFLWLLSTLALVDYRRVHIRWTTIVVGVFAVTAALGLTANIASEVLGISTPEFAELALSRFFLYNDARALAFDFGGASGRLSELAASSFRGLATRVGHPPIDPPLGLQLYEQYFGVSTGNGANASLAALIVYYSMRGYALFPALLACFGLAAVYAGVVGFRRLVRGTLRKMAVTLVGLTLVQQLSQDFLAFQLLVPLACAAGFLFIITDRKYAGASPRRPRPSARLPVPQHRHSGT